MGLFKKLRKGLGKVVNVKNLGKLAGLAVPGVGTLGQVAISKLASAGLNRNKLRLASQGKLVAAMGPQDLALIGKPNVDFRHTATGKGLAAAPATKRSTIKIPKGLQVKRAVRVKAPDSGELSSLYRDWKFDAQGLDWDTYARTFLKK